MILVHWKPVFFLIPIESVIRDRQIDYYTALREADESGKATCFIEFLLAAILASCQELTGEVQKLLKALAKPMNRKELQAKLRLKSQANFRERYLKPALEAGLIEMTIPDKPRSSRQKYRLTVKGKQFLA